MSVERRILKHDKYKVKIYLTKRELEYMGWRLGDKITLELKPEENIIIIHGPLERDEQIKRIASIAKKLGVKGLLEMLPLAPHSSIAEASTKLLANESKLKQILEILASGNIEEYYKVPELKTLMLRAVSETSTPIEALQYIMSQIYMYLR